jgi:fatty-acyl-CoA synthase
VDPDCPLQSPALVRFVTEFPMTITGTVQKFALREHMIKEPGLSEEKTA